jgi:hypothetical protein
MTWTLRVGRPTIEIVLSLALGGQPTTRLLLADTGAGSEKSAFELVLDENDCLICGGNPTRHALMRGAYTGSHPIYGVRVRIPSFGFSEDVEVVGVPSTPTGFDGIVGFRFLNRFTYGNFGDRGQFGLEF